MPKKKLKKSSVKSSAGFAFSANTLLIIGVLLISFALYWDFYEKTVLSFNNFEAPKVSSVVTFQNKPVKLIIPSRSIDLNIEEAVISGGNWETNPTGASHLLTSAIPGERGNMIIYGHNKKKILGKITSMKKGEVITVVDQSGGNHDYRVLETLIVKPSDVWVLDNTDQEVLTLYTCTGIFDSKRFVIKAEPVN